MPIHFAVAVVVVVVKLVVYRCDVLKMLFPHRIGVRVCVSARVCVMVNAAKNETNEWKRKKTAALIRIGRSYVPFQFDLCDLWAQETHSSTHTHAKYSKKKSNNMEFTPKWLNHSQVPDTPKIKSTKMHSHTNTENFFIIFEILLRSSHLTGHKCMTKLIESGHYVWILFFFYFG